jgi:hypothetical protein
VAFRNTVELDVDGRDDPIRVTYSAVDYRRYEAQFHKSVLVEPLSMTMLTYLGWSAARRQGILNGSYEKWADFDAVCTGVRTITEDDDDEGEDPNRPTQTGVGDNSS